VCKDLPKRRRLGARELGTKLRYLLAKYGTSKIVEELSSKTGADEKSGLQRRTVQRWLSDDEPSPVLNKPSRDKIVVYFHEHHGIDFKDSWFECSFEEFKHDRDGAVGARPSQPLRSGTPLVSTPQAHEFSIQIPGVSTLTPDHIALLSGKYLLYRYSFRGRGEVVVEVITISSIKDNDMELEVVMYCHPVGNPPNLREASSSTSTIASSQADKFVGKMFRLGHMFTIVSCFSSAKDRRLRCLHFPVLKVPRLTHYGLIDGYSLNLNEPVAARIVATKINSKTAMTPEDYSRVKRGIPNVPGGPEVPEEILHLIVNTSGMGESSVLTVDQKRVIGLSNS
jgi:hypothetical protein